jgi:hypothetical protein
MPAKLLHDLWNKPGGRKNICSNFGLEIKSLS